MYSISCIHRLLNNTCLIHVEFLNLFVLLLCILDISTLLVSACAFYLNRCWDGSPVFDVGGTYRLPCRKTYFIFYSVSSFVHLQLQKEEKHTLNKEPMVIISVLITGTPLPRLVHHAAAPSLGDVSPSEDPFFSTPAALLYTAQVVELIADVLDQPLPYPISRRDAIRSLSSFYFILCNTFQHKRYFNCCT